MPFKKKSAPVPVPVPAAGPAAGPSTIQSQSVKAPDPNPQINELFARGPILGFMPDDYSLNPDQAAVLVNALENQLVQLDNEATMLQRALRVLRERLGVKDYFIGSRPPGAPNMPFPIPYLGGADSPANPAILDQAFNLAAPAPAPAPVLANEAPIPLSKPRKRRPLSKAARARISAAQKTRWALQKAWAPVAPKPAPKPAKKKSVPTSRPPASAE